MKIILLISCLVGVSFAQKEECYIEGECITKTIVAGKFLPDERDCLELCRWLSGNLP